MLVSKISPVWCRVSRFLNETSGGITAFTAMIFSFMLLAFGMSVDFMRHETYRAELQNAVDRGLLAAAATTQTLDREATVRAYLKSTNFVSGDYELAVVPTTTDTGLTQINATASYDVPTYFLKLVGITSLQVSAAGAAIEGVSNVEISLALDISGSMSRELTGGSSTLKRLDLLKTTSKTFVDSILENGNGKMSINLIPYSGQVNIGQTMFNAMASSTVHNYSRCIDFSSSDFTTEPLPASSRGQTPHFQYFRYEGYYGNAADWGWCPSNTQEIEYFTKDADALKTRIEAFRGHDGTGTNIAMKWALGLLDPAANSYLPSLIAANKADPDFSDRPSAFNAPGTMKVIVLMTDGNTRYQRRPYSWAYNSSSERTYYASNYLRSGYSYYATYENTARTQLSQLCTLAKAKNVIVFTIAFDVSAGSNAYNDLSTCASSTSHFYDIDGLALSDAFAGVASTIHKLKLVQ